ncbi:hypothetical protein [Loktanella sp. DSM 29012]|uniref:hypothetical protein n=1 Tax=Loktanella sp. DSM 29012 TaxID=1881056 RepID=UPI000B8024DD|nr:hypothetical protein [Loktanella sp. DSM 29012]
MQTLIWIGAVVSVLGLCGVVYSIIIVARAKRADLTDAELRARIGAMMPINLGAFFSAMLGLMMVVVGILLG